MVDPYADLHHLTGRPPSHADARRAIFSWINRYNHQRLHSSLDYTPPVEWENRYRHTTTKADQAA